MENIGQANVFHEFLVFPRFWACPRTFFIFNEFGGFIRAALKVIGPSQDMTLTQDASKGGVPEQRLLKKTLVNGGGPYIHICM